MSAPRSVRAQLDRVPYIAPAGVVNAAGATPQTGVAAGSVVSIFGASLAPDTVTGPASPLAQTLGGVAVRMGDRLLPLFFVSPSQINVQLPDDVAPDTYRLTVSAEGLPDVQAAVTVVRNAPGLFQQSAGEKTLAVAVHEDGSAITMDAPARRGELVTIYGTGFGPTDRPRPAGFALPDAPPFLIADPVEVSVGDGGSQPASAFAVAGRIGVDAAQFRVPGEVASGVPAAVLLRVNGQDSNTVLLPVQ